MMRMLRWAQTTSSPRCPSGHGSGVPAGRGLTASALTQYSSTSRMYRTPAAAASTIALVSSAAPCTPTGEKGGGTSHGRVLRACLLVGSGQLLVKVDDTAPAIVLVAVTHLPERRRRELCSAPAPSEPDGPPTYSHEPSRLHEGQGIGRVCCHRAHVALVPQALCTRRMNIGHRLLIGNVHVGARRLHLGQLCGPQPCLS
jgi:hypothetical protein